MKVKVKYFASLREKMGKSEENVELMQGTTVQALWKNLSEDKDFSDDIKTAVNLEYVKDDTVLVEGDEVAFFPPVTGG